VTELVVAPAAIVPTKPRLGAKTIVDPAPKTPASAGDCTKFQPFDTMLNLFKTVALIKLYTKGLRLTPERKSLATEVAAALALGAGATCAHINLSITFLNEFAIM
jgi:hypothetical protein